METETKRKCYNCGVPHHRGIYCPKCDKICFVSIIFDEYIANPEHRLGFLESLQAHKITDITDLRLEAKRRDKPLMKMLADSIDNLTRSMTRDTGKEIFRRALDRSLARSKQEAKCATNKREAWNAVYGIIADAVPQNTENEQNEHEYNF